MLQFDRGIQRDQSIDELCHRDFDERGSMNIDSFLQRQDCLCLFDDGRILQLEVGSESGDAY